MIVPINSPSRGRGEGFIGSRAVCDTPGCRRSTYLYPSTEKQAMELSPGSVPGPWVTARLTGRKWSIARGVATYCPEHTIVIEDDAEIDDRTHSEKLRDRHAARRKLISVHAEKNAQRRARTAAAQRRYLDKKRGNK